MAQKVVAFGQKIATRAPALATKYGFQITAAAKRRQPALEKFWTNAKVELAPPGPSDWPAIKKAFSNIKQATMTGRFLNTTVKDSVSNTLVAVEIAMWFYIGEIIGRRSIVGYNV
ncbi:ATP synthase subunit g, mitochondrial [Exaiptasia diaphana]|uniref:ATP synthase subunit n=1 Tax=Exaiptasia diaphana TaxID=2652724 RepID=A0A913X5Q1_EXADI|nr:ATP synthase subunit g, mitochondrial [Exaiptasia diaphana]KXJ15067.1 ATP synthase subunit g, mitochondrial [Exaiptasia diaphana]